MIGIISASAGALILPSTGSNENIVLDLIDGQEQDSRKAQYMYSAAQDWMEIEEPNVDSLLRSATEEYWVEKSVSFIRVVLNGLEKSLAIRVFLELEEVFQTRLDSDNRVLSRLLVAPLRDACDINSYATLALGNGFSLTAAFLDELRELQPLLRKFTDIWLGLPESLFVDFSESKEAVWIKVVDKCNMRQLLKATNKKNFLNELNLVAFHFKTAQSRSEVSKLARDLSQRLFSHESPGKQLADIFKEDQVEKVFKKKKKTSIHVNFQRVKKQIAAITEAVSQGNDGNAQKFLRELVLDQTSVSENKSYVIKSLCNIARQCADMFRLDFEQLCLSKAIEINSSDPWTLVQYGDHFKRLGKYTRALEYLAEAEAYGENEVAKSSEADVYSQQGNYLKSIKTYKTIPGWENILAVLTGIADNLRRMGRFDEAEDKYKELVKLAHKGSADNSLSEFRAIAGMAEIAKRRGLFKKAVKIYRGILKRKELKRRDRLFYKKGLCNILKSMGAFDEAYKLADEIVQQHPFSSESRFIRGSILALIGREVEGLNDLPDVGISTSWRGWLHNYYRGLLLFKLDRFHEAKISLVDGFSEAIASGEDKTIMRMAAALWYLREDDLPAADEKLAGFSKLHDYHSQYLSMVLKLHSATKKEDLAKIKFLRKEISKLQIVDESLYQAVLALDRKDYVQAFVYETDAFLKYAA
jgi:tetratricopeptide (TPR) repeat protein